MKKFRSFLELQDSLSSQMKFSINGKSSYHSSIGIILSLLINFACICLIINKISILIAHNKPNINYMKSSSYRSSNITLNTDDLIFTIGFRDISYKVINDPTILTIEAKYIVTSSKNGSFYNKENYLDFMNCSNISKYFYKKNLGSVFESTGLKDYTCFSWKGGDIILGGYFATEFYSTINIALKKCVNNTENKFICKSQEYIDSVTQNGWLEITYITSYVDIYNYSTPIQYEAQDFYTETDSQLTKRVYMYFNPIYFYSENNILFSYEKVDKAIKFDRYTTDINRITENRQNIYLVNLVSSTVVEQYFRKYDKLQDLASTLGGTWYGLGLLAYIIMCHYKEKELNCFIANSLFTFIPLKENEKKTYSIFVNNNHEKFSKLNKNKTFTDNKKNDVYLNFKNKKEKKENLITSEYKLKNNIINSNKNNLLQIKCINNDFSPLTANLSPGMIYNKAPKRRKNSMIVTEGINNSITNIKRMKKIDYHFGKLTYTLFCSCTQLGRNLNKEYGKVLKELQKYTDFVKLSLNLFDLEKIKEVIIEKGISENWVSKSKIVYINQSSIKELFIRDNYNPNEIRPKLLKENILNNNNIINKNQDNEDNKIEGISLFKKTKDNENKKKNKMLNQEKDNCCIENNIINENEKQAKNNNNKVKENDNKNNNNSVISSLYNELKNSSVFSSVLLK